MRLGQLDNGWYIGQPAQEWRQQVDEGERAPKGCEEVAQGELPPEPWEEPLPCEPPGEPPDRPQPPEAGGTLRLSGLWCNPVRLNRCSRPPPHRVSRSGRLRAHP